MPKDNNWEGMLEKLAELEHKQWIYWSQEVAFKEKISAERKKRWMEFWIPYENLTEEAKELDRQWARKVFDLFQSKK